MTPHPTLCNPVTLTRAAWIVAGIACLSIWVSVMLALLPSTWVGTPYTSLAERLNPGIDAPDNWAVAFTYFLKIVMTLLAVAIASTLVACWSSRSHSSSQSGHTKTR